jgi:hypothetical protein
MKKIYIILLCLFVCTLTHAQKKLQYNLADYAQKAVWIKMMDDPNANFFEVEKAYKIYWQHHVKPEDEHDVIGEHSENAKIPDRKKQRIIEKENHLRLSIKKYENWHRKMLPYVQADGRILSADERLKIWKDQQQNSKK